MIYEKHNLFENINNLKGTKDMRISRELIVSELAKVILSRPHEVKRALKDCGVAVSDRPSKKQLVKKVSFNVARSRCLRYNLGALVAQNQMPFGGEYSNAGGNDWAGAIGDVIGTGFGIWQTGQSRKEGASQRAHEMDLANKNANLMMKQMELQSQLTNNIAPTQAGVGGSSTTVMLLLGLGVIGIIGFVIWSGRKKGAGTGTAPVVIAAPTTAPATTY